MFCTAGCNREGGDLYHSACLKKVCVLQPVVAPLLQQDHTGLHNSHTSCPAVPIHCCVVFVAVHCFWRQGHGQTVSLVLLGMHVCCYAMLLEGSLDFVPLHLHVVVCQSQQTQASIAATH